MNKTQFQVALDVQFRRSRRYKDLFQSQGKLSRSGEVVLADLRKFCRVDKSTAHVANGSIDPVMMALLEGRREVFMRILSYLNTDEAEIIKLKEDLYV